jgi:hypothetical protein
VIQPAKFDLIIQQGATFTVSLQLKDGAGAALNMTGYTVTAQVWSAGRVSKMADLLFRWDAQTEGRFTLYLPAAQTTAVSPAGVWDMLVTNPDGTKDYWLRGSVSTEIGYTQ